MLSVVSRPTYRPIQRLPDSRIGDEASVPYALSGVEPSTEYYSNWFVPDISGDVTMGADTTYSVWPSTTPISTPFTYAGEKIRLYMTSGDWSALVTGKVLVGGVQDTTLDFDMTTRAQLLDDMTQAEIDALTQTEIDAILQY